TRSKSASDGQFGSPKLNEAGEQVWSGAIGDLISGTADVAIGTLVITYDRERVVDFTTPFMGLGLSVIMKKPEQQTDPLHGRVWTCMLLAWLLTSLLMLVCARLSPYEWYSHNDCVPVVENQFGALNSMWFTIGSLMQQVLPTSKPQDPNWRPGPHRPRMVATTWWFFTLLLISSYTANLAAFLTTSRLGNIDSVEALASQSKVKFGCPVGGAMYNFFKNVGFHGFLSAKNESFVRKTSEGIGRVREGGYAYILESTFNQYYRERDCELTQIGGIFNPSSYAFAVPQGNAFLKEELGEVILQLHKEQFIEDLSNAWIKRFNLTGPPCSEAVDDASPTGTMERPFLDLLIEHLRLATKLNINQKEMSPAPPPCACNACWLAIAEAGSSAPESATAPPPPSAFAAASLCLPAAATGVGALVGFGRFTDSPRRPRSHRYGRPSASQLLSRPHGFFSLHVAAASIFSRRPRPPLRQGRQVARGAGANENRQAGTAARLARLMPAAPTSLSTGPFCGGAKVGRRVYDGARNFAPAPDKHRHRQSASESAAGLAWRRRLRALPAQKVADF
uniref:PBPe domain-containing protein n=1 Tax=Macrostomum lignano TaxID=282301 RepID=A0A1I8JNU6_9PLAT